MRSCLAVAVAVLLAARTSGDEAVPVYDTLGQEVGPVGAFTLTDQLGRTVRGDDLRGKVWVANFFFTTCAGDCSKTNASMARLQTELADCPDVRLVGFSVNPDQDTPEVLRAYAKSWGADPGRWLMLTGSPAAVDQVVQKRFFQTVERDPKARPGFEVVHTFRLMLVDQDGQIRGYVDGREPSEVDRLKARMRSMAPPAKAPIAETLPWPSINACLNGTCAVLLVLGYVAIRRRWVLVHKVLMLAALAVSAAFLTCYLYYHIVVRGGEPTRFSSDGAARVVYLAILFTHTILAVVVAPLALVTAWLGVRGRLRAHVTLARLTLPTWLYVSVTGVVVYTMLYHLYPPP